MAAKPNNMVNADGTYKPPPPSAPKLYQVMLLFIYHVVLGVGLAYAIYNVWPPQPWPGDVALTKEEAAAIKAAAIEVAGSEPAGGQAGGRGSATERPGNSAANANATRNANIAAAIENRNAVAPANANTANAAGAGAANDNSAQDEKAAVAAAIEEKYDPYRGDRPPSFYLFGKRFSPSLEVRLILLVMLAGAIGSYVHASSSFVDYLGNRTLISSWVWWYLLRPFIGIMLALLFYFVFRGGFITAGTNPAAGRAADFINPFGVAALAGLVGMFSKIAADKLNEVFITLFRPEHGDAKRGDKLTGAPAPTITGILPAKGPDTGGQQVTLTGTGFAAGATITFDKIPATDVNFVNDTSITATTPPHAAGAVLVEVVNSDGQTVPQPATYTYIGGGGPPDGGGGVVTTTTTTTTETPDPTKTAAGDAVKPATANAPPPSIEIASTLIQARSAAMIW